MNPFLLVAIILIYLAVLAFLGYRGFKNTSGSSDYLVAGRNAHPLVMALSYGATFISTSALVGFSGVASLYGFSLMWLVFMNIFVGIFIAFTVFGKRTRHMGLVLDAHTFPEFLSRRVGSPFIQGFAGLVIFIFMPIYTAAVLIGGARIMEGLLGVDYSLSVIIFTVLVGAYVIMGGLKGVMYTDALQGGLIFIGMLFLLGFVISHVGGFGNGTRELAALSEHIPESMVKGGISSWTGVPKAGSPVWWTLFSTLVLSVGVGTLAQPQLIVRFMTVKSGKEMNRAVLIGGIFIFFTVGAAYLGAPLMNVHFFNDQGIIAIAAAGGNTDAVLPTYINTYLPSWFSYLFMLAILSAGMSTLSSQFHTIGTSIGRDFFEQYLMKGRVKSGEQSGVIITRIGILAALIASAWLAFNMGAGVIARATAIFFGLMASCFLSPYALSLYWRGLTRKGAIAGVLTGFIVACFYFLFMHTKEAVVFGLCQALFGRPVLVPALGNVDQLVFSGPLSLLATVVVSLLTKVENPDDVALCFKNLGKRV